MSEPTFGVMHEMSTQENSLRRTRITHHAISLGMLAVACLQLQFHASSSGTLPWERPMTTIATSLTGPVAYAIGLIGIAIAGGTMLVGRRTRQSSAGAPA